MDVSSVSGDDGEDNTEDEDEDDPHDGALQWMVRIDGLRRRQRPLEDVHLLHLVRLADQRLLVALFQDTGHLLPHGLFPLQA